MTPVLCGWKIWMASVEKKEKDSRICPPAKHRCECLTGGDLFSKMPGETHCA